jgi:hypothetical protein
MGQVLRVVLQGAHSVQRPKYICISQGSSSSPPPADKHLPAANSSGTT